MKAERNGERQGPAYAKGNAGETLLRRKDYCNNTCEILYDSTSGHFVQQDNPDWVNENLLKFFKEA